MKIDRLRLFQFRNVTDSTFFPSKNLNFLIGLNGQGKTSFLEAICYLSDLRSFREKKLHCLVQNEKHESELECRISQDDWVTDLKTRFEIEAPLSHSTADKISEKVRRWAYVNQKLSKSSTGYLEQQFHLSGLGFHSIVFNPSDHELVRGEPPIRRSYLDSVISAEKIDYLKLAQRYRRVLDQRNNALKSNENGRGEMLDGFTDQLVHLGSQIAWERLNWVKKANVLCPDLALTIAPTQGEVSLQYRSSWLPAESHSLSCLPSVELIQMLFQQKLKDLRFQEKRLGYTLIGPHRDDWGFQLGQTPLKGYGSQGEVRSALLALKLSELQLYCDQTGRQPVFLMDDFSSELDDTRRKFLLNFLSKSMLQVFVTTTEGAPDLGQHFVVENGTIKEAKE